MDSFGYVSSQRVLGADGQVIEDGPSYKRSHSFKELAISYEAPDRVTWTLREEFTEGYFIFRLYEESDRILSHNEQGRHLNGIFLDKARVDRIGANTHPITDDFYPVLKRLLDNKTNWGSEFSFRGLAGFSYGVMEWTQQVLMGYEQTLRQAGIYGLVIVSQFPYAYSTEVWRAFCELWSPLTNTLHHGGGEMGISLNDLKQIVGLSIPGEPYEEFIPPNEQLSDESKFPSTVLELLQIHSALCRHYDTMEISWWRWQTHFHREKITYTAYEEIFEEQHLKRRNFQKAPRVDASKLLPLSVSHKGHLAAFLAFLLSRFVLPHGGTIIRPQTFVMACLLAEGTIVSLAPTVLGHIFHCLGEMATHELTPGRANPSFGIHFVIGWLGEYFSCLYARRDDRDFAEKFPLLARYAGVRANSMTISQARSIFRHTKFLSYRAIAFGDNSKSMDYLDSDILPDADFELLISICSCVLPVRVGNALILEPYYPNRFARQAGFDQGVPSNSLRFSFSQRSQRSLEDIALSFARLFHRNTSAKFHIPRSCHPGSCTLGYCKWWVRVSTPYTGQSMSKIQSTLLKKKVIVRNPEYIITDMSSVSRGMIGPVRFPKASLSSSDKTPLDLVEGSTSSMQTSKRPARERSSDEDVYFKRLRRPNRDTSLGSDAEEQVDYGDEATSAPSFDPDNANLVVEEPSAYAISQSDTFHLEVSEPSPFETRQSPLDVVPLDSTLVTLHTLLSPPMDDWVRDSIKSGVNSIIKSISSLESPQQLNIERPRTLQSLETLKAIANLNNVDLSAFTSRVEELFDSVEVLAALESTIDFGHVEKLSIDLAQCRSNLELKQAELPQLSQESAFIQEQEAELSALKEQVKGIEADLRIRKANLETKGAALQNTIKKCESELQQLEDKLDQAGRAKVEELNTKGARLQDLLSDLTAIAPPY